MPFLTLSTPPRTYTIRMKRFVPFLLLFVAVSSFAFDTKRTGPLRVGILSLGAERAEERMARAVETSLVRELQKRGYTAEVTKHTLDEQRDEKVQYDVLVEVLPSRVHDDAIGGVAAGDRNVGVEVGVVVSEGEAAIRTYDGRSFEQLDEKVIAKTNSTVAPTAIGIGGRHGGLWISLPIFHGSRNSMAASIADAAAAHIDAIAKGERAE